MGFRFRLGPFTFGRTGVRLSLWGRGGGVSVPLTGKGRTVGKIGFGPFSWYFGGSRAEARGSETEAQDSRALVSREVAAIEAFRSDQEFLERLRRYGVPWRGVQERLKEEFPDLPDRDNIAYRLVPAALDAVFGPQETGWTTERRPSKSGRGHTTWIVTIGRTRGRIAG